MDLDRLNQLEQLLADVLPPTLPNSEALSGDKTTQSRPIRITFRMTIAEESWLKNRAQGMKLSAYIRSVLFTASPPRPRPIVPSVNRETCSELGRIGSNLNQQTRMIHRLEEEPDPQLRYILERNLERLETLTSLINQVRSDLILGREFEDSYED